MVENVTAEMLGGRSTQIQIFSRAFRTLGTPYGFRVLLFVLLAVALGMLMRRTVVGRHLYALGGNEPAARLSGIRTDR